MVGETSKRRFCVFSLHLESIENVNSGNDFDPETASDNSDRADITITLTDPNDNSLQSTHHLYIGVIAVDDPTVMDLIESPVQVNQGETVTIEGISAQDPDNDIDHLVQYAHCSDRAPIYSLPQKYLVTSVYHRLCCAHFLPLDHKNLLC